MIQVVFAAKTVANWELLANVIPIQILDKGSRSTKAYEQVLSDINQDSWAHIHYSFYYSLPDYLAIFVMSHTNLRISFNKDYQEDCVGIMTGNLNEWQEAIEEFCKWQDIKELREFFNVVLLMMEKDSVPFTFSKHELKDKTFTV